MKWIVTRHHDTVRWIQTATNDNSYKQIEHLNQKIVNLMRPGDRVYGVLPIHLIRELLDRGIKYYQIVLPNIPPEKRGKELNLSELREAGIRIYHVKGLEMEEVRLGGNHDDG